jgi:DnaJ-class molecular chaperone
MTQALPDPFNTVPSNASDAMRRQRESIPPQDRCLGCDGFGMIVDSFLRTYRVCQQCKGSGRNNFPKSGARS